MQLKEIGKMLKAEFPGKNSACVISVEVFDAYSKDVNEIRHRIRVTCDGCDDVTARTVVVAIARLKGQLRENNDAGEFHVGDATVEP